MCLRIDVILISYSNANNNMRQRKQHQQEEKKTVGLSPTTLLQYFVLLVDPKLPEKGKDLITVGLPLMTLLQYFVLLNQSYPRRVRSLMTAVAAVD